MSKQTVKILYISGWGRSGSTLLSSILGQVNGFFSAGEVRYIWDRGFLNNRLCECGKQFRECEFWHHILNYQGRNFEKKNPAEIIQLTYKYTRTYNTFSFLNPISRKFKSRQFEEYQILLQSLYSAISEHSKSDVIVDSSKFPVYGAVLSSIPNLEVYYIHLIRDPRAVAYSWKTPKKDLGSKSPAFLTKFNLFQSATKWMVLNVSALLLGRFRRTRYLRIKYEDLSGDPQNGIKKIISFIGKREEKLPFDEGGDLILGQNNHIFAGNPDRFKSGNIRITPDTRWIQNMRAIEKLAVTVITLPFLLIFGYRLSCRNR